MDMPPPEMEQLLFQRPVLELEADTTGPGAETLEAEDTGLQKLLFITALLKEEGRPLPLLAMAVA